MSTKRIEGYVDQFSVQPHSLEPNENITFQDHKWLSGDVPATLVIHSGKFEPVFTQSEVMAMLREVQKLVSEGGQIVIAHDDPQAEQRWQKALRKVRSTLKNHGIEAL